MPEAGNAPPVPGWRALFTGRTAVHSLALAGGVALHALNIYVAITIMPSAVADIGGLDWYAWSTTLFVVASILGSALSARLLDRAGARGAYVAATLVFAVGTLACAAAPSMAALLLGRFVQGFGGGLLYALAYGVIRLVLPEALWSRAIGLISATWGVATLVGPALGGVFAELGEWRAAFWSLVPVAAGFAALALAVLPRRGTGEGESGEAAALPVPQLLLLAGAVLALSVGSIGREFAWNAGGIAGALAAVGLLIAVERRSRTRLLPSGAFSAGAPLGALYATAALLVMGMQPEIFVPYLLQLLHGQPPLAAGYLAALMAIGWTLGSMAGARCDGAAARRAVVAGPACGLAGLVLLACFLPVRGGGDWAVLAPVCAGLVAVGFGIGLAWPHLVTGVFRAAPASERGLAAAAVTTVQLFATAFGAAAAGMTANLAGIAAPGGPAGASSAALWLCALFAPAPALAILTALRAARSRAGDQDSPSLRNAACTDGRPSTSAA
ncbi:MFS transporter [Arenibaculum sp.]|jgi:MFS family permease|uniref:MFS transporter n=1 Tax=Arenibaculum sp. TaxID=2865862 RepID=UPI002E0E0BAE|nr:MFS transporter [Arenibaculum sp.]